MKEEAETSFSSEKKRDSSEASSTEAKKKKGKVTEVLCDEIRSISNGTVTKETVGPCKLVKDNNAPLPDKLMLPPHDQHRDLLPTASDRRCPYCNMRGSACHNKRYGRYAILATIRYRRKAGRNYQDELAKAAFMEAYAFASEFELFLSRGSVPVEMKEEVPECMMKSSFAIALLANDWNFFIHGLEKAVVTSNK